jgi:hypothetical protein
MENIGEIRYYLFPLLMNHGPCCVLVLITSNRVVLFFNGIPKGISGGGERKYCKLLCGPLLRVCIPLVLNMRDNLEE